MESKTIRVKRAMTCLNPAHDERFTPIIGYYLQRAGSLLVDAEFAKGEKDAG